MVTARDIECHIDWRTLLRHTEAADQGENIEHGAAPLIPQEIIDDCRLRRRQEAILPVA